MSDGWGNPRAAELRQRLDHIKALATVAEQEARELRKWIDGEVRDSCFTARLPWLEAERLANHFAGAVRDCNWLIEDYIESPWSIPDGYTHVIELPALLAEADRQASDVACPDHGAMTRYVSNGVVVAVQCGTCGRRPIDLLADVHFEP